MVLFLNKKKLQEQKPLANNTYQGKYDYSQMQYLPEDQRFGFDTLVEVARDTNKKSLWDIFSKKPKMVFPVGEGMSEEETKKAKEILSEEDLAVKGYREGSFFTRPTAGFYDPMASGFMKDIEIAQQTLFSQKSTREEKIEAFDFLMQPIISASQPLESASGKIPTTTPKGKIKSSVLKIFAKDKNPLSIERSLRQMGIDDINAKSLSFDLAKANTADEVGDALVAFSNKPLSIASKNVADDVASGVAKQATSISDDLAKLKLQTTEPQIAETNLIKEAEILRGTKGMTADDIMATYPNIKLKRDIPATTISGVKTTIKEGEKLTPYELKGNKILLQDGKTYIVSKNQFQNIKGQSVVAEGKPFAPELKQTEETIKGGPTLKFNDIKWTGSKEDLKGTLGNRKFGIQKEGDSWYVYEENALLGNKAINYTDAVEKLERHLAKDTPVTKYSSYTLPGGENYREILIKAPVDKTISKEGFIIEKLDNDWLPYKYRVESPNSSASYKTLEEAQKAHNKNLGIYGDIQIENKQFKSSHWDEPNVISHLRLNERTYKGKKVTFMEELQSDWAREGRDKGFSKEITKETAKQQGFTVEKSKSSTGGEAYFIDNTTDEFFYRKGFENTGFNTEAEAWDSIIKKLKETTGAVPNNPLLKNWQELSIKRALKDAVDNNSDYFAWINGEQTSARYNLSHKLKDITWEKAYLDSSNYKDVNIRRADAPNEKVYFRISKKDGTIGLSDVNDWNGKKLDEVLGKGLADKIMAKESGTLSGEGLKFGGEWASNLYDRQVKNIVEKLTGQKVEMLDMGLPIEKQNKQFTKIGKDEGSFVTIDDIKKGLEIADEKGTGYIITEDVGNGKFKAIQKSNLDETSLGYGLPQWIKDLDLDYYAKRLADKNGTTINDKWVQDMVNSKKRFIENYSKEFDISKKKSVAQMGIKLTPEVKNKIKGIAPKIKTSGKMFEEKPQTKTPAVIQGETFTLGTSKTTQPTTKELKLDLKATQKEIKNAQIAQEKANKLERKEQKIREEAIANLQRFRGNLNNIEAELKAKNLSDEDIDNIVLENGMKLRDVAKVKRNNDGSLSTVITKKEIDDLLANYTDEVSREKWVKKSMLVNAVEVPINLAKSIELPYSYFERKGLSSIYDEVIESQRTAELMRTRFIKKFEDAGLYKKGSWFTANRFAISDNEAKGISKYYLGRQGRGKEIPITDLSEKSQEFVRIFDEIIDETTENFYKVAQRMGKKPGVVENYAPIMTRDDIKLIDQGGTADWLFRKHPAFFSLKERVKKAPEEIYETDYRKVATRWIDGISQFISMGDTTNHLKYLVNSDEFSNIVKGSDKDVISKWLKDITTPKIPNTTIKKALTPLSKLLRKGVAMGALGLNYATVLKQALTQIPIAIIEKSLPKTRSKYAKAFGINASDLPSISKRTGDIAISDMQGKIGRIFTGGISEFDKKNAQFAINGLLDKEYNKFLKSGAEITPQIQKLIEKNAQDKIDMWFGGFFKGQRPEAFREEAGNFILMFTYPLTSQLNGFFRNIFKAKGFGTKSKAIAEVLAAVVGIAYMEKVIENLSLEWSDEKEMTKDILISLTGNIPLVGDIAYSIVTGQSLNISPVISNIDNIVRSISDKNTEKIAWNVFETIGLPKQIRRVKEGMEILEDGGITDNNGKMLAPVQDAMEYIRAFLRGKYGPIASQDYIRNIGKSKDERRWFVPEVEFLQNGDYNRKAELYKSFDRETQRELYNFLSENQQKKLDKELDNKTDTTNRKSLSDIFK